jgi:hypothetical protein
LLPSKEETAYIYHHFYRRPLDHFQKYRKCVVDINLCQYLREVNVRVYAEFYALLSPPKITQISMLPEYLLAFIAARRARRRRLEQLLLLLRARMTVQSRNYLVTGALCHPQDSPWHVLYQSRDPGSFVCVVSIDPDTFDYILQVFNRHYIVKSGPGKRGRPPKFIYKHAVLGCLLHYYSAAVEHKTLCELFGVPPATFSRVMTAAALALQQTLREIPEARIQFPDKVTQQRWASITNAKEPLVQGVWGFVDGKNYRVQSPSAIDLQNAFYNGT